MTKTDEELILAIRQQVDVLNKLLVEAAHQYIEVNLDYNTRRIDEESYYTKAPYNKYSVTAKKIL